MSNQHQPSTYELHGLFPCPIYIVKRDSNLSPKEKKDIEDVIEEGTIKNSGNFLSVNNHIFNSKLKKLKQFCEQQLNIYVKELIIPKEELDIYITQSWLNINRPGDFHHPHSHPNSIISGVFYVSSEKTDKITFNDPNDRVKAQIKFDPKEFNVWNSSSWNFGTDTNMLILFPSWLEHSVQPNEKTTTDRISLSFNTFVSGSVGNQLNLTELVLK